jgi:CRP-like cAMP-binding protein
MSKAGRVFESEERARYTCLAAEGERMLRLAEKLLFQGLTPAQLERVGEIVTVREVAAGETIVRERDYGETLYVLDEGRVEVRSGTTRIAEIRAPREGEISKAGDFFGEMCLLDLEPRCATIVAAERCVLWEINRDDLYWIFGDDKELQLRILLTVARVLSRRLTGAGAGRARGDRAS